MNSAHHWESPLLNDVNMKADGLFMVPLCLYMKAFVLNGVTMKSNSLFMVNVNQYLYGNILAHIFHGDKNWQGHCWWYHGTEEK